MDILRDFILAVIGGLVAMAIWSFFKGMRNRRLVQGKNVRELVEAFVLTKDVSLVVVIGQQILRMITASLFLVSASFLALFSTTDKFLPISVIEIILSGVATSVGLWLWGECGYFMDQCWEGIRDAQVKLLSRTTNS